MEEKKVKRYSLSKQVADQLEKMIENQEYTVGQKIPTEVELMEIFSVSRNTVREAVQSLTSAGVLEVKQGDGTYVRSSNRFDASMSQKYDQVSSQDIHETRQAIEIALARFAALRRTEQDIRNIQHALSGRQELKADRKENTQADIDFHIEIAKAAHNKLLLDLYLAMSSYLESHILERNLQISEKMDEVDLLHEKLYLAIKEKNVDAAGLCAKNILDF